MGKISEWQSRQLASSAVGVPSPDRSGEIIASGLQQGVQGVAELLAERKDKLDTLEAAPQAEEFRYQLAQKEFELSKTYGARENYQEFPKVMREEADKLQKSLSEKMSSGAKVKFDNAAATISQGRMDNWFSTTKSKQVDFAVQDHILGFSKRAANLATINDPDQFFKERTATFDEQIAAGSGLIDPSSSVALANRFGSVSLEAHLDNRLVHDTLNFERDLTDGRYPADQVDRDKWMKRVETRKEALQQERVIADSKSVLGFADQLYTDYLTGNLSLANLRMSVTAIDDQVKQGKANPEYAQMVKQIVTATENRIITGPKATTPLSEAKADSLIIDWRNHVDANAENGAKEYLKVLKYYSELWDEYGAGNIGDEKFRQYEGVMRTEVSRKMSGGKNQVTTVSPEKALKIAASGSLGMNWTKTAEEYGISAIKKYLEPSFKGKSRSEQGRIMVPYLSAFFKAVSNASPSVMQSLQSDNAEIRRKAAENLVLGTGVGKDKVLGVVDILDRWIDPSTGADIKPGVPFTNKNGVLVTPILKSPDGKIYFVETKKVKFQ